MVYPGPWLVDDMPFALILIGAIFAITAYNGTGSQLWALVIKDFTGTGSFIWWALSIFIVGAVGYVPQLKAVANAFLLLVVLAIVLSNKGFFSQFQSAVASGDVGSPAPQDASYVDTGSSSSSGGSGGGSSLGGVASLGGGDVSSYASLAALAV